MSDIEKDLVLIDYGPSTSINVASKGGRTGFHVASYCEFKKQWTRFDGGDPNDVSDLLARVVTRECCND